MFSRAYDDDNDEWCVGDYPYLCIQRALGQNALARERATDGSCAAYANTRLCNYDDCIPTSMACPITNITTVSSSSLAEAGGWIGEVDQNSNTTLMVYNRSVASLTGMDVTPEVEVLIGQDVSYGARPDSRYRTFQQYPAYDVFSANYPDYIDTLTTQKQTGTPPPTPSFILHPSYHVLFSIINRSFSRCVDDDRAS
jgi:hypothetical protein